MRAAATCLPTLIEIGRASDFVIDAARWLRFLPVTCNLTFRRFPTVTLLMPWICCMGSSRLFAQGRLTLQADFVSAFPFRGHKGLPVMFPHPPSVHAPIRLQPSCKAEPRRLTSTKLRGMSWPARFVVTHIVAMPHSCWAPRLQGLEAVKPCT